MLTPSCSLSEGGGSSQDRARKDHSLDQLDQVLHNIDKGPSSLSSDSEIRFSLFCQNLITPLSVLTIPLSIHSFVPLVIHQQVFIEHRHYSRHWDAASNMKGRIDHKFFSCGIRPQPSGKASSLYPRSQSHTFNQTSSSLYSNKPITFSCGNQGAPHPLVTAKLASLSLQVQPLCGPAWRVGPSHPGL